MRPVRRHQVYRLVRHVLGIVHLDDGAAECVGCGAILVDDRHLTTVAHVYGVDVHDLLMRFLE